MKRVLERLLAPPRWAYIAPSRGTNKRRRSRCTMVKPGNWIRVERPTRKHKLATSLSSTKRNVAKAGHNRLVLEDGSRWNSRRCVRSRQPGNQQLSSDAYTLYLDDLDIDSLSAQQPGYPHYYNDSDETDVHRGIFVHVLL